MENRFDHSFYQNRSCEHFPCHSGIEESCFSCLFCYCPLYTLGTGCGGNFRYTEEGIKDCSFCTVPHRRENYDRILSRFPELQELASRKENPHE